MFPTQPNRARLSLRPVALHSTSSSCSPENPRRRLPGMRNSSLALVEVNFRTGDRFRKGPKPEEQRRKGCTWWFRICDYDIVSGRCRFIPEVDAWSIVPPRRFNFILPLLVSSWWLNQNLKFHACLSRPPLSYFHIFLHFHIEIIPWIDYPNFCRSGSFPDGLKPVSNPTLSFLLLTTFHDWRIIFNVAPNYSSDRL